MHFAGYSYILPWNQEGSATRVPNHGEDCNYIQLKAQTIPLQIFLLKISGRGREANTQGLMALPHTRFMNSQ